MSILTFDFITGFSVGIELFFGDDAMDGDQFAVCLDLGIFRLTYIKQKK